MAKKEKKQKKGKRSGREKDPFELNAPHADSDRARLFLARLLIVLSLIFLGLLIHTIHYMSYATRDGAVYPAYEISAEAERYACEGARHEP